MSTLPIKEPNIVDIEDIKKYQNKISVEELQPYIYLDPTTTGCYTCSNKQVCHELKIINKPYGEICSEYKTE